MVVCESRLDGMTGRDDRFISIPLLFFGEARFFVADGALYNTFKGDAIGFRRQRFIGFGIE
ncbi:MAG: hypothetical protein E6043_04995 [Slackia sp.]|nr:hypothetical protein [Slackia sp.]